MNAPKHEDPAAPVKVGWGTAVTVTVVGIAVLTLAALGGLWLRRGSDDAPAAGSGQSAVVEAASASASRQLAACQHELALGGAVATAADAAYRDWGTHVQAQLRLDRGEITLARTQALWASSKQNGPSDIRTFTTARAAWAKASGACQAMATTAPADGAGAAGTVAAGRTGTAACMARHAAVQAVVAAGADVSAQWAAHLQMMANKAHTDAASYSRRWRQMVQEAPATLRSYEQARSRLAAAPRCGG